MPTLHSASLTRTPASEAKERSQLLKFLLLTRVAIYVGLCTRHLAAHDSHARKATPRARLRARAPTP